MTRTEHSPPIPAQVYEQLITVYRRIGRLCPVTRNEGTPAKRVADYWRQEEDFGKYDLGYPDFPDRPAMVYALEAFHQLNGGLGSGDQRSPHRRAAIKLLNLALAEIEGRQRPPQVRSQPVLWWELINQAEAIRARHGLGLASVWKWIHRGDYERARAELDRVTRTVPSDT